jgi:hypothetical protein
MASCFIVVEGQQVPLSVDSRDFGQRKYRAIESHGTTEVDRYEQLNIVDKIAFELVTLARRELRFAALCIIDIGRSVILMGEG